MSATEDASPSASAVPAGASSHQILGMKRQFVWSMLPLLVLSVVNIVSVPLFLRYLGPELYALWFYVNTLSGTFGFFDLGLGTAVARYVGIAIGAQDKAAVRGYWGTGNMMAIPALLIMAAVFIGVGVGFGPHWFTKIKPQNIPLLQWCFVAGGASLFLGYYNQFWWLLSQAHFDFKFIGLLRSGFSLVTVVLGVWLAYLTRNPLIIIIAYAVLAAVQLGAFAWHARRNYQLGLNLRDASRARAREMFGMSAKVFGSLLVNAFGGSADRLLLGRLAPTTGFAHYTICYNFGQRILGLGSAIMYPVFHQTSRALGKGDRGAAATIYNQTFDFTFGFYVLGALWTVFWHPVFLRVWLGHEIAPDVLAHEVGPVFVPLVISFCVGGISIIAVGQLAPLDRTGIALAFSIVNAIVVTAAAILGWFWGGLIGVAWGMLAGRVVLIAQDLYVIRMLGAGGWLAARTWKHFAAQCGVGAVFFLPSLLLARDSLWQLIPAVLHGGLVAFWLSRQYVRKILSAETWESVPGWIRILFGDREV